MSKTLPDFSVLAAFYPATLSAEAVKLTIGGDVNQAHYKNTCVIRISQPLNHVGHLLPPDSQKFRTKQGKDKRWYGLRVDEFWDYMTRTYGKPTIHKRRGKDEAISAAEFADIRGIIGFRLMFADATGHFTLWNGSRLLYSGGYANYFAGASEAALWEAGTTRVTLPPA